MLKKVFNQTIEFIKITYKDFLIILLIMFALTFEFPYYIDATGGAINVSDRIEVENKYESKGSFNMAYVQEYPGNIMFLTLAALNPNWDIVKYEDVLLENETREDEFERSRLLLNESTNNAIKIAYGAAGKEVKIKSEKLVVTFVTPEAKADIKAGDEIVTIDGNVMKTLDEIKTYIGTKDKDDILKFIIKRDGKEKKLDAKLYEEEGKLFVGFGAAVVTELETNPKLTLNFEESESGPSGGLMTSLAIYDSLVEYDLTHGKKIIGTGTMEPDGKIGPIGGVKYKLAGAVKKKADIFLVPAGENYDEALKLKKKHNYDIKIVAVAEFADAVKYLMTLE